MAYNKVIEAILKISAKHGDMRALSETSKKLKAVDLQAKAFNRSQAMAAKATRSAIMATTRYLGPAALAYGTTTAVRRYASVERQMTRTAIKLGATKEEADDLQKSMRRLGKDFALPNDAIMETIDAYAETGASLSDIKSDIEGLVKAQQGMDASGADTVATWDAARKSFGLLTKDADKFFDRIAAGGAIGKFEGSDLARYLPSLMPVAAANGMTGIAGTENLIGLLETMRDYVGTSQEAATATADFLDKINSPAVEKNFAKFKIDLPKALKEARDNGEDLIDVMARLIKQATKGDASQLGKLFPERDSRRFAALLLQHLDEIDAKIQKLRDSSDGMISNNVNRVLDNAEARLDRLSNSWDNFLNKFGGVVANPLSGVFDAFSDDIEYGEAMRDSLKKKGMSYRERENWIFTHTFDTGAKNLEAFEGGYWPDKEKALPKLKYPSSAPVIPTADLTVLPSPRPDRNVLPSLTYPITVPDSLIAPTEKARNRASGIIYSGMKDASDIQAKMLDGKPFNPLGDLEARLEEASRKVSSDVSSAGENAGRSIEDAARSLNEQGASAGQTFARMVQGVGRQIGIEAATSFKENVGSLKININQSGLPPRATGNPGRSMPNAGRLPGPV